VSDKLRVENTQVLSDLRNSLRVFAFNMRDELNHVDIMLQRVHDDLKNRVISCQRELERCEKDYNYAQEALWECESQDDDDYGSSDCSYERDEFYNAKKKKAQAERRLQETRNLASRVTKQIQEYRKIGSGVKRISSSHCENAISSLQKMITGLNQYISVAFQDSENASSTAQSTLAQASTEVNQTFISVSNNTQYNVKQSSWVEKGISNVKLGDLPSVKDIDEKAFQKISQEEMKSGLMRYLEMKNMIDNGCKNSRESWAEKDREMGLRYRDGYLKIYDAFWGPDKIRVTKDGEKYTIENGRHRIWLAREMGIAELPMSVVEKRK